MDVNIKELQVEMPIKNNGITLSVASNDGKHIGNLIVTKTSLIYCAGKTQKENGVKIKWEDFIKYTESLAAKK